MKFSEILSKGRRDAITTIKERAIDNEKEIDEYANKREQRDTQVGKRENRKVNENYVEVNKIPIPFQKQIVKTAAAFLFGSPVQFVSDSDISELNKKWNSLRLDGALLKACEQAKAFKQSAILFRLVKKDGESQLKLKVNNLDPRKGVMVPNFDEFDDMDGFLWETQVLNQEGKEINRYYLWDDTMVRIWEDGEDDIVSVSEIAHGFDRIPVVYVEEEEVEYEDVKDLIDRFEMRFSRFADVNDYFSSPFFKAVGKINNVPEKDETGTIYMMDVIETPQGQLITSDIDVISWDAAPESTKLELELTRNLIYDLSQTPDLSFDNVKGIGNVSGIALKLMFLNTIIKQKFDESIYKVFSERVFNVMRSGLAAIGEIPYDEELDYDVYFTSILPENVQEIIEMLSTATFNKPIMSQETALKHLPLISDPQEELERLKKQDESNLGASVSLGDF